MIELLVVISIIAILAGILLPVLNQITHRKNTVVCLNNLRQIGTSTLLYCNDNNGHFPPDQSGPPLTTNSASPWNASIHTYLGLTVDTATTPVLKCPEDSRPYLTGPNVATHPRSYVYSVTGDFSGGNPVARLGLAQQTGNGGNYPTRTLVQVGQASKTIMYTELYTNTAGASVANNQESYTFSDLVGWQTTAAVPTARNSKTTYYHGLTLNAVFVDGHAASLTPTQFVGNFQGNSGNGPSGVSLFTAIQ